MFIFPPSSLLTSEYEKVREKIASFCVSTMGKERVNTMQPGNDQELIQSVLDATREAYGVLSQGLPFPTSGYVDAARELSYLRAENSVLSEIQLVAVRSMVRTAIEVVRFFKSRDADFPILFTLAHQSPPDKQVVILIDEVLDEGGAVLSSASPELARIRRSLARNLAESDRIYASVINKYRKNGWVTESPESSRNGRRVIAIFAEQKRTVRGIVHDLSATGKTAFVEPEETIGINNQIQQLEADERQEILRILRELTKTLRKFVPDVENARALLGNFDFLMAKGAFAIHTDARFPQLSDKPGFRLINARHPLLLLLHKSQHKTTVPFDLELGGQDRILVISGPNAGGKTVCMKTAGLLQMMVQSGLPVTAHEDSSFGIFENILVDIGDSQSIEYELSTYSSRLRHMRVFLEKVNARSLFLIDEFGTGTDPNLGGALAESVLETLNASAAIGIITTHYINLKVLADRTPGIINGSMEFDLKKLEPLYKLHIGKPGSSYTFLVAERSGLPREVIKNARKKVSGKHLLLEKLLTETENEKLSLKANTKNLEEREAELTRLLKQNLEHFKQKEARLEQQSERLKKLDARLNKEFEDKFKNFIKEWRKVKDKKEVVDKYYGQFIRSKKEASKAAVKRQEEKLAYNREHLKPGALVRITNTKTTGTIKKIDGDTVLVIFGDFLTKCEIGKLDLVTP